MAVDDDASAVAPAPENSLLPSPALSADRTMVRVGRIEDEVAPLLGRHQHAVVVLSASLRDRPAGLSVSGHSNGDSGAMCRGSRANDDHTSKNETQERCLSIRSRGSI